MILTVGSLFSGIGGLDLGLERAGMRVIWNSEIDPYACRVLKKHWPNVPNIGDIRKVDWNEIRRPDVICGGYPCQPFSLAGDRRGTDDERHLWPYFRDAVSVLRPRYAILENVRGHLSLGGNRVIGDLAEIGYDAEWQIISAASVGAPHQRDRLIIVAYPTRGNGPKSQSHSVFATEQTAKFGKSNSGSRPSNYWEKSESGVCRVANGIPNRVDQLRALGNAVVPQVAEYVGEMVISYDRFSHGF